MTKPIIRLRLKLDNNIVLPDAHLEGEYPDAWHVRFLPNTSVNAYSKSEWEIVFELPKGLGAVARFNNSMGVHFLTRFSSTLWITDTRDFWNSANVASLGQEGKLTILSEGIEV